MLAGKNAVSLYGSGIYLAECSSESDKYAGESQSLDHTAPTCRTYPIGFMDLIDPADQIHQLPRFLLRGELGQYQPLPLFLPASPLYRLHGR